LVAEIDKRFLEAVPDLPVGVLGKADAARLGYAFQACCNIDAVAHQVAVGLRDYIAEMNAYAELYTALGW
jgi:hypothetical protein